MKLRQLALLTPGAPSLRVFLVTLPPSPSPSPPRPLPRPARVAERNQVANKREGAEIAASRVKIFFPSVVPLFISTLSHLEEADVGVARRGEVLLVRGDLQFVDPRPGPLSTATEKLARHHDAGPFHHSRARRGQGGERGEGAGRVGLRGMG